MTELKQHYQLSQALVDQTKEMLNEEKDKNAQTVKELRQKNQEGKLDLERRLDELKLSLSEKDDALRRLEFELEKQDKMHQMELEKARKEAAVFSQMTPGSGGGGAGLGTEDVKKMLKFLGRELKDKELEVQKLRLTKDFELQLKDMERQNAERIALNKQETKRAFDLTMENMKSIYDDEIKELKKQKKDLEDRQNALRRELIKREGDVQLLQEKIRAYEKEKNLKLEHAQLLVKLSNALKGYADAVDVQRSKQL